MDESSSVLNINLFQDSKIDIRKIQYQEEIKKEGDIEIEGKLRI